MQLSQPCLGVPIRGGQGRGVGQRAAALGQRAACGRGEGGRRIEKEEGIGEEFISLLNIERLHDPSIYRLERLSP
jgi:hypothetical protein